MRKKRNRILANEKGLTLIEVLISVLILSLIAMTFMHVFLNAFDNSIKAQEVTNYTYATQAKLEELRTLNLYSLISSNLEQEGNQPFDTDEDGSTDCYMRFNISPQGIPNELSAAANIKDPVFVYMIYLGDKVLVLAQGGDQILYTDASVNPNISLDLTPSGTETTLTVNGETITFDRADAETNVIFSSFLNYKDFGYESYVEVEAPSGLVYSGAYGTPEILDEFEMSKEGHLIKYSGMIDNVPFMFKIDVELFHEQDDAVPFYDMSTLLDISLMDIKELAKNLE